MYRPLAIVELIRHLSSCCSYFAAHCFCNSSAQNNLMRAGHEARWGLAIEPAAGGGSS